MEIKFEDMIRQIGELRQNRVQLNRNLYVERQGLIQKQALLGVAVQAGNKASVSIEELKAGIDKHLSNIHANLDSISKANITESGLVSSLYETNGGFNTLVQNLNDRYPILFFPVRVETAFAQTNGPELWVRIFPDDIAVDTHEPDLTEDEIIAGTQYWQTVANATEQVEKTNAWDLVARSYGAPRAAWVVLQTQPDSLGNFPALNPKSSAWTKQPVSNVMPDAFVVYAYDRSDNVISRQTAMIPDELKLGIDPGLDPETDELSFDSDGSSGLENDLRANDDVKWMIDFDVAIAKGLGIKIQITDSQYTRGFKKILVVGVKASLNQADSQKRLEDLINNHHYTDGFALLKQGTSTNNTATQAAGYTFHEQGSLVSHSVEREGPLFTPVYVQRNKKDGQLLCEALGIEFETLEHIFQAGGSDISSAMSLNSALFQVSLGYAANEHLPIFTSSRAENNRQLRSFFTDYIRGRGALPSIRSGTQPYGVLPASVFSRMNWSGDPNAGLFYNIYNFSNTLNTQFTAVLESASGITMNETGPGSLTQQYTNILSQHAVSTEYVQRIGMGAGSIWNSLEYAALANKELSRYWLSEQVAQMNAIYGALKLPIPLKNARALHINYLDKQQRVVESDLVAPAAVPLDQPLPKIGKDLNFLELLSEATFNELRDEDFKRFGLEEEEVRHLLSKNVLYQFARQSLMLEAFEAAGELLELPAAALSEKEIINIFEDKEYESPEGEMGHLSFGQSRLQIMEMPYGGYEKVSDYLSSGDLKPEGAVVNWLDARASLRQVAQASIRELNLLTAEILDTSAYRMDTWRLSLVNQRLNAIRGITEGSSTRYKGIYLGAYGWVTDIKPAAKNTVGTPAHNDGTVYEVAGNRGFIHAPSINQAVTAAVLRSGYNDRAKSTMSDPFSVNLSSERLRAALDIMEGIRNGQELGVLLGYEFERRMLELGVQGENPQQNIYSLRKKYSQTNTVIETTPLTIGSVKARNVVNGMAMIEQYKQLTKDDFLDDSGIFVGRDFTANQIEWVWNILDAVGDLAMSEGMFHIVQGNPVKGGAIMQAASKGSIIAEPDVIDTIKTGIEVPQRFTLHFNTQSSLSNNWDAIAETPRYLAESNIGRWLSELLPDPSGICCLVQVADQVDPSPIAVADLGIQAIDLMYMVNETLADDDSVLSLLIKRYYRTLNGLDKSAELKVIYGAVIEDKYSFNEIHAILVYARKLVTACRPINTHDYMTPQEAGAVEKSYVVDEFEERIDAARQDLSAAISNLEYHLNNFSFAGVKDALFNLSFYNIEQTIYEFVNDETPEDEAALIAWANAALAEAQKRYTESELPTGTTLPGAGDYQEAYITKAIQRFKTLFGAAFAPVPLFEFNNQAALIPTMVDANNLLADHGDDLVVDQWLAGLAKVREMVANYELLNLVVQTLNPDYIDSRVIKPVQVPYDISGQDRWMALSVSGPANLKEGVVAIGADLYSGYAISNVSQAGIVIDEWTDIIPNREETTGISFHHNQPNAKAPQCLILGLSPQITGSWSWNDIVDMLNETFELAKARGLSYEQISGTALGQILPLSNIPVATHGNAIALSAHHIASI